MKIDEIPVSKKSGPGREIFEIEKIQKKFRVKNRRVIFFCKPWLADELHRTFEKSI